jgi:hypothetical protein
MSPELEKRIFDRFPKLFQDSEGNQACTVIEVGDGWLAVIVDFLQKVESHLPEISGDLDEEEFRILEIKEKYGSLRIHTTSMDEVIFDLIQKAGEDSLSICELTGEAGFLHSKLGMVKTLSPVMAERYEFVPVD